MTENDANPFHHTRQHIAQSRPIIAVILGNIEQISMQHKIRLYVTCIVLLHVILYLVMSNIECNLYGNCVCNMDV